MSFPRSAATILGEDASELAEFLAVRVVEDTEQRVALGWRQPEELLSAKHDLA